MILDVKLESCKIYLAKRSYILFYHLGWYYTPQDTKNTTKNWVWATKDQEIMMTRLITLTSKPITLSRVVF